MSDFLLHQAFNYSAKIWMGVHFAAFQMFWLNNNEIEHVIQS